MNGKRMTCLPVLLVASLARSVAAQEDPGVVGPLAVTSAEYTGSDLALDGVVSEVLAKVHHPTSMSNGPYPLVLFLHGQHTYCYDVNNESGVEEWPCLPENGHATLPSYQGYDYAGNALASHGMIVVSISANAINAADDLIPSFPRYQQRVQLILHHLAKWATFNASGGAPFGSTFVGKVDLQRIGLVGHSRGGQTVMKLASEAAPAGLRAVLAIAPTGDGLPTPVSNLPLGVLLGYCDQDQLDLQGVGYVDQARYALASDNTRKYTILGRGANHNYFNSVWGPSFPLGGDDWTNSLDPYCGASRPTRLDEGQQHSFAKAYIAAFFRRHLLGVAQFDGYLNGDLLPPPSAQTQDVYLGYLPGSDDRKDLNRLALPAESTTNNLNGSVTTSGVAATACGDTLSDCVVSNRRTHWGDLAGVRLEWDALGGTYSNALPQFNRDVSNFATLQFRVGVDYTDADNPVGEPQDFSIRLTDGNGRTSTLRASDYSDVLYYPPGTVLPGGGNRRAVVMNSLRVPLSAFPTADITNVASVSLVFDRTEKGRVIVSDIAFADEGMSVAEKVLIAGFQ